MTCFLISFALGAATYGVLLKWHAEIWTWIKAKVLRR